MTASSCRGAGWFGLPVAVCLLLYLFIYTHIPQGDSVTQPLYSESTAFRLNPAGSPANFLVSTNENRRESIHFCYSNPCFPTWLNYTASPDHACGLNQIKRDGGMGGDPVDLLVLISSAADHHTVRASLRSTWGVWCRNSSGKVRLAFVTGRSLNRTVNAKVEKEMKEFRDIVQGDYLDSYANLTLTTMMGMRFAVEACSEAKFLLKADDDVWVNIPALLRLLSRMDLGKTLGGNCYHVAYPRRLNKKSKWFVSYREYPRDVYPAYCAGAAYVMSMPVARAIYQISRKTPFFWIDDVFIGMCLENLGYGVLNLPGFYTVRPKVDWCEMKMDHVITSHPWNSDGLLALWQHHSDCSCPSFCRSIRYFLGSMAFVWTIILIVWICRRHLKHSYHTTVLRPDAAT